MPPSSETDSLLVSNPARALARKSKKSLILVTAVFEEIACRNYQVGIHQAGAGNAILDPGIGIALLDPNARKSEAV
ncbi:uncharacterized protein N7525_001988 [Penicillium rubens]|uniref:uncharacterized protein n=1 Tax=Penicillium rubens TaxID=1108849 RepID=UPI002A5A2A45|nr:uncharacterized protein N7525_001988 [Penicillium rubens]KAJ5844247.1 hypothetical protein N7525_001988 [Penicillium rubens]